MYKKRIVWYKSKMSLNQAICSGLEFSFVSKDGRQCCPFVLCKDYLQDAIYNQIYNTKKKIFGFQYNPSVESPVSLDKVRLLIANSSDRKLREKIPICLDFLHQIEAKLKIKKTKVRECANPIAKYSAGGVWFFESSRRWLISPPMISLYTLLLRVSFSHTFGNDFWDTINGICNRSLSAYQYEDVERLTSSMNGIKRIFNIGDRKIFPRDIKKNYPRGVRISNMHNDFGICGFSREFTKKFIPEWHRENANV